MCTISMVYDHYNKKFPWPDQGVTFPTGPDLTQPNSVPAAPYFQPAAPAFQIVSKEEIESLRALISDFREAVAAAKIVDKLTEQPDCEDPEKKKLEIRVAWLEEQVAKLMKEKNDLYV